MTVEVFDGPAVLVTNKTVTFNATELPVGGDVVMERLLPVLQWRTGSVDLGGRTLKVVIEISHFSTELPTTAWVLTHFTAGGESEKENVSMYDISVGDGDRLHWCRWNLRELAAATKAKKQMAAQLEEERLDRERREAQRAEREAAVRAAQREDL